MALSVRQKLYLLFGFQVISFAGLFCSFYFYIIPAVKRLETEKDLTAQIIKKVSKLQLIMNHYFEGNINLEKIKEEIKGINQILPNDEIKKQIDSIYKKTEDIERLNIKNSLLHKRLFEMLDKSIKSSNNYIKSVSYKLESKQERSKVSDLEIMVLRLAVINTQTNNDVKRLFLSLYSNINNVTNLYKILNRAIENAKKATEMLEGSPLIILPQNAIKSDIEAKKIIKEFEANTRKKLKLIDNTRKGLNNIIVKMGTTTTTMISKIRGFISIINILIVLMALIAGILIYTIIRSMNLAISELQSKLPKIAEGNLNYRLVENNKDEFGKICKLFNEFVVRLRDNLKTILNQQNEFISASEKLAGFTNRVTDINIDMIGDMKGISQDSSRIRQEAEKTVSSIEQLRDRIDQVNMKVVNMTGEVSNVAETVKNTNSLIERLNSSAQEIGHILKMINDITEQINLLSLNATIEAARAGKAGKGFTVVANEIKDLASETSKATDYIKEKIVAIQDSSKEASEAMDKINSVVEVLVESFDSITQISEEQKVSAQEGYASIENTAQHLSKIDGNISLLHEKVKVIGKNIKNTKESIAKINTMIEATKKMINQFNL